MCSKAFESREAISALAKHVILKAPDKADSRSIAINSAVTIVRMLPAEDQYQLMVFAACLSRSAKVHFMITQAFKRLQQVLAKIIYVQLILKRGCRYCIGPWHWSSLVLCSRSFPDLLIPCHSATRHRCQCQEHQLQLRYRPFLYTVHLGG